MGRGATIRVGEHATLRLFGHPTRVKVVEDRGKLAPGRQRLLRLGLEREATSGDAESREMELSESTFDGLLIDE